MHMSMTYAPLMKFKYSAKLKVFVYNILNAQNLWAIIYKLYTIFMRIYTLKFNDFK